MRLFDFMGLLWLFLDRQQRIDVLLDGFKFPELLLRCGVLRVQSFLSGSQLSQFGIDSIRGGQRHSVQPFQLPCSSFKQDDLTFVTTQEFLLVRGSLVLVIDGLVLAVGGGILGNQGQVYNSAFCFLDGCKGSVPGVCQSGQFTFQFLVAVDPMLCNEVDSLGRLFQILQLRPMLEPGTLFALDIYEQPDTVITQLRLPGRTGASGNPGSDCFLRIVDTQGL